MKRGKAQDIDGLTIEHIEFSHPALKLLLAKLFNYCIHSGAVPTRFGLGLTVPIPKNGTYRNNMKYEEFRGISINSVLSKILKTLFLKAIVNISKRVIIRWVSKRDWVASMSFIQ